MWSLIRLKMARSEQNWKLDYNIYNLLKFFCQTPGSPGPRNLCSTRIRSKGILIHQCETHPLLIFQKKSVSDRSGARLEKSTMPLADKENALALCLDLYEGLGKSDVTSETSSRISQFMNWSPLLLSTLALLMQHLKEFGLQHVLARTSLFHPFASLTYMQLPGQTMQNLQVLSSNEEVPAFAEKNAGIPTSLLAFMDHTVSAFGKRLLRKWLSQPLLDRESLETRRAALDELLCNRPAEPLFDLLHSHLKNAIDLEKSLSRIQYGKANTTETYGFLIFFAEVQNSLSQADWANHIHSSLLKRIYESVGVVEYAVTQLLTSIDATAAQNGDKINLLTDSQRWPEPFRLKKDTIVSMALITRSKCLLQ